MSCHTVPLLLDSTCVSLQIASETSPEEAPDAASGADTSANDDDDSDDDDDQADDADSSIDETEPPVFGAVYENSGDDRAAASAQVSAYSYCL